MKNSTDYAAEAKARWGNTEAYQEFEQRGDASADIMSVFREFGAVRDLAPENATVQKLVADLQAFITEHYYTCSNEILAVLGKTYVADERFRSNIDDAAGIGTAELVSSAISIYCGA